MILKRIARKSVFYIVASFLAVLIMNGIVYLNIVKTKSFYQPVNIAEHMSDTPLAQELRQVQERIQTLREEAFLETELEAGVERLRSRFNKTIRGG